MSTPKETTRRDFALHSLIGLGRWAPWLGFLGFRVSYYDRPILVGWRGSVHWFGRCVAFIRLDGTLQ